MSPDRSSIVGIVACVLLFFGYQAYMAEKYPHLREAPAPESVAEEVVSADLKGDEQPRSRPSGEGMGGEAKMQPKEEKTLSLSSDELRIETATAVYQFDQEFSALSKVMLKDYKSKRGETSDLVSLLDSPLKIQGLPRVGKQDLDGYRGYAAARDGNTLSFSKVVDGWKIRQSFFVPDEGYSMGIEVTYENVSGGSLELDAGLLLQENMRVVESGGFGPAAFVAQRKTFVNGVDGGRDMEDMTSFCEDEQEEELESFRLNNVDVDFVGTDLHYFLKVVKPDAKKMSLMLRKTRAAVGQICPISIATLQPMGLVKGGEKVTQKYTAYFGPKDFEVLKEHDSAFAQLIDFNMMGVNLSVLAKPLLFMIKFFHGWIPNYGVAIILLTICLKILFYPLQRSAAVSMKRMQKLQPEMNKIKEKYKSDPAKQQQQLMKFMSVNKANPMKGCLPILPQMPVFISFYSVLSQSIELRHADFFGWVHDLSAADPYYIMPLLLGGLMFVQQKVMPQTTMDPNQQKVMMMMPLIFTVMMLGLPAGLVLYMIVNTVVSIVQQQWLNRKLSNLDFKVVRV